MTVSDLTDTPRFLAMLGATNPAAPSEYVALLVGSALDMLAHNPTDRVAHAQARQALRVFADYKAHLDGGS